ncbi:histone acetyltransferase KAT2A, partial [Planoprotostelium fungivorum]
SRSIITKGPSFSVMSGLIGPGSTTINGPHTGQSNGQPQNGPNQASIRLRNMLEKMTKGEKVFRAATQLHCQERVHNPRLNIQSQCPCEGWRKPAATQVPGAPNPPQSTDCGMCKHSVLSHGIQLLKHDELDRVVVLAIQMEQHTIEASKAAGNDQIKYNKHMEVIKQIRATLKNPLAYVRKQQVQMNPNGMTQGQNHPGNMHPSMVQNNGQPMMQSMMHANMNVNPMMQGQPQAYPNQQDENKKSVAEVLGVPPFDRPTISQLLRNFVELRYSQVEPKRHIAEKLVKFFEATINRMDLSQPPPTSTGPNALPVDRMYTTMWKRWKYYCRVSPEQHKMTDIFGRNTLRFVLKQAQIREFFGKVRQASPEMESFVPEFFNDLDKENSNDQSPIHREHTQQQQQQDMMSYDMYNNGGMKAQGNIVQPGGLPQNPAVRKRKSGEIPATMGNIKRTKSDVGVNGAFNTTPLPQAMSFSQMNNMQNQMQNNMPLPMVQHSTTSQETQDLLGPEGGQLDNKFKDKKARTEEARGVISFQVFGNDRNPTHMTWLCLLKNIFAKQLPKMPKDYIVRLVFDRNHRSLALLKGSGEDGKEKEVVGGISFRPFKSQGFLEIAFCAITTSEQVRGYGTILMNHLKVHAQSEGIHRFLTFADNYAIGYFKKQGFSKTVSLEKSKWQGYIKDYDGGTLMECVIYNHINYLAVPEMVQNQRKAIYDKIKEISQSHIKYKGGLDQYRDARGIVKLHEVPGVRESGWNPPAPNMLEIDLLMREVREVIIKLKEHPNSWPFHHPVDRKEVPDYYQIISDPIDLEMIEKRFKRGNYYITKEIFLADVKRMCDNCRVYNREDTDYFKLTQYKYCEKTQIPTAGRNDLLPMDALKLLIPDHHSKVSSLYPHE